MAGLLTLLAILAGTATFMLLTRWERH